MPNYDKDLECVSLVGRMRCKGTCREQHLKYVGNGADIVDCVHFVDKDKAE